MADNDLRGQGWIVSPSQYIKTRPAICSVPKPISRYLEMRDGCKIAADIYLPDDGELKRPTILIQTPYYRRFAVEPGARDVEVSPNVAKYRDTFASHGYAVVVIDIRGTGASFGTRDSFRSPRERDDAVEIVDWIIAQPWSNGTIGATGISYLGAASDFLASTAHPAVKAIAPLFAVWDTYLDNYYPGGVLLTNLADVYDQLMVALDHDNRELIKKFAYYSDPHFRGPQPVDEDVDGSLCREAITQHLANFRMPAFITELEYRNEPVPHTPSLSSAGISPSHYASGIQEDVAVYSVSGWMDGAGYMNGAISRFLSLPNKNKYLLLGPWDHGARINVSPWRAGETPEFDLFAEILRFFDEHLLGLNTGLRNEQPIHYFTLHEEAWHSAASWPPIKATTHLFMANADRLLKSPERSAEAAYRVDFGIGTGHFTRYERIAAIDSREYYTDWSGRDEKMLNYTSAPLEHCAELTGHCTISLWMASDVPDFAVHAYLSEIEKSGHSRYVTEGLLRALHRQEVPAPANYRTSWSFHSCTKHDAQAMPPGRVQLIQFALLPISWEFAAGSRLRLSIAGADADHCKRIPDDKTPNIRLQLGGNMASAISLPLRTVDKTSFSTHLISNMRLH
jgi:putative CocE/NonD family hydrolase